MALPRDYFMSEEANMEEQVGRLILRNDAFFGGLERSLGKVTLDSIKDADFQHVQHLAARLSKEAVAKQNSVIEARAKDIRRKSAANLGELAESARIFLKTFQDIRDIAVGLDQRVGSLLYGTIAVVIILGSNKNLHDNLITEMLRKFDRWLSRLPSVLDLERDNKQVISHVLNIYVPIINLLRETIQYYTKGSWHRIIYALIKPPTGHLEPKISQVTERIIDLIHELTIVQLEEIKHLRKQKDTEEDDNHFARMRHVAQIFGHSMEELAKGRMFRDCQTLYSQRLKFPRIDRRVSGHKAYVLEVATVKLLKQRPVYMDWDKCPSSCLLLLGGSNFRKYAPQQECWLSPVAMEFCSTLCSSDCSGVAFCSLTSLSLTYQAGALVQMALKTIVFQLLENHHSVCRQYCGHVVREYNKVTEAIKSGPNQVLDFADNAGAQDWGANTLFALLRDILSSNRRAETVYIVIDGVEKLGEDRPTDLFMGLFYCLDSLRSSHPQVVVKILAICCPQRWLGLMQGQGASWHVKWKLGLHGQAQSMQNVFIDLDWRQTVQG